MRRSARNGGSLRRRQEEADTIRQVRAYEAVQKEATVCHVKQELFILDD
jgi:hypothetical protein